MRHALLVLLVACGPKKQAPMPPPPPPDAAIVVDAAPVVIAPDALPPGPLDRDLPRLAQRSVALYAAVSTAFRTAGTDCAAVTKQLGTLRGEYAEVIAANAKVLHDGRSKELKAALAKHDDQLEASAKEIVGSQTIKACASDRAFTKAFDDLVAAPP